MKRVVIALLGSIALVGSAIAEEQDSGWSGEAELGFVATSGNTDTQSLVFKGKALNVIGKWNNEILLDVLNAEADDVRTAERYFLEAKTKRNFTEHDYGFGNFSHTDDRFSGYQYRTSLTAGYGRHVLSGDIFKLDLEAGVGGRRSKPDVGNTDNEGVLRLAGFFNWQISDTAKFTQDLISEIGSDVTISRSLTALSAKVNSTLAVRLSYGIRHTSEVPPGIEKVDRETAVTLVYGF